MFCLRGFEVVALVVDGVCLGEECFSLEVFVKFFCFGEREILCGWVGE